MHTNACMWTHTSDDNRFVDTADYSKDYSGHANSQSSRLLISGGKIFGCFPALRFLTWRTTPKKEHRTIPRIDMFKKYFYKSVNPFTLHNWFRNVVVYNIFISWRFTHNFVKISGHLLGKFPKIPIFSVEASVLLHT